MFTSVCAIESYGGKINIEPGTDIVQTMEDRGLFFTLNPILNLCYNKKNLQIYGIRELLEAFNRSVLSVRNRMKKFPEPTPRPFINIESIYAAGRTHACKLVANNILGKYLTSPPRYMKELRRYMKTLLQKKVYYALAKYSTALQVRANLLKAPVILERYWLDHATFIIAKVFSDETLPPEGSPIYEWPRDLLRPDVVFFINASCATTGNNYTDFTKRLITVYRRMRGPKIIELSPSPDQNNVTAHIILQKVLSLFTRFQKTRRPTIASYVRRPMTYR